MAAEFGKRQSEAAAAGEGTPAAGSRPSVGGAHADTRSVEPAMGDGLNDRLRVVLRRAAELAAAGLIGFGVILWVAAHWTEFDRLSRIGLVAAGLGLALAVAMVQVARVPGLLVAFLATGGLFAVIGQAYQLGADPWPLFAVWAALGIALALAARSDAVWVLWTIVAKLAIVLWLMAVAPHDTRGTVDITPTLAAWAMALAIPALLSAVSPLRPVLGETRWAFRVSLALAMALLGERGIIALFQSGSPSALYVLSLAALALVVVALLLLPSLDLLLVSVAGLAIDVLLMGGLVRALFGTANLAHSGVFLFIGLVGAAIVAGTGALILALRRDQPAQTPEGANQLVGASDWPVIVMTGIGALIASIPIGVFLAITLGGLLLTGGGSYLVGAGLIAAAVSVIRTNAQTSFVHQLAAVALTLGFGLVGFSVARDFWPIPVVGHGLILALSLGIALSVGPSWTAALLGSAGGVALAVLVNDLTQIGALRGGIPQIVGKVGPTVVLATAAAWYVADSLGLTRSWLARMGSLDAIERFIGGAVAAALVMTVLVAGPTFLLSGALGGGPRPHAVAPLASVGLSTLSLLLATAGAAVLLVPRTDLQTTLGLGAGLVAVALAAVVPSLGGLVLLGAAGLATGRRVVAGAAIVTALWVVGSFYYDLTWPLAEKAALLGAAGVTLAMLRLFAGPLETGRPAGAPSVSAPAGMAPVLVLLAGLATAGVAGQTVMTNEETLASGRKILVALRPVDPRSLIQGDYMRLEFAIGASERRRARGQSWLGERRYAVLRVDSDGLAQPHSIGATPPTRVRDDEVVVVLTAKGNRFILGTDAWYFREGTAKRWETARFGIFRVGADGNAILVGLADEDRREISP